MPNWAMGTIEVTGKEPGVISFVERFSDWLEPEVPGKKNFARSIVDEDRSSLIKRIRHENHGRPKDINIQVDFEASFAWSAYSCLVSGYPQAAADVCIPLERACREDGVSVQIYTEESGNWFEEELHCDSEGNISYSSKDLTLVRCRHCGETQGVSSHANLDEVECCECGQIGFDYVKKEEA